MTEVILHGIRLTVGVRLTRNLAVTGEGDKGQGTKVGWPVLIGCLASPERWLLASRVLMETSVCRMLREPPSSGCV